MVAVWSGFRRNALGLHWFSLVLWIKTRTQTSRAARRPLTRQGWKLNRWCGLRLWTLGYKDMQPNLWARIVWVTRRDHPSPSHTAAHKSDGQSVRFWTSQRGDISLLMIIYCSYFCCWCETKWTVRLYVSIINPAIQIKMWPTDGKKWPTK